MSRITEHKLKDKRFRRTEEAIIVAFFTSTEVLSLERLIRNAGISRATLYRHHGGIANVVPNYEQYILQKCSHTMQYYMHVKNCGVRSLYHCLLIFLFTHKKIIQFLYKYGSRDFTTGIVMVLEPKITSTGKVSAGEMFKIYAMEVAVLIETWEQGGFDRDDITATLNKIMYLTDTAKERLGPLFDFSSEKA